MSPPKPVHRRDFLTHSLAAAGGASIGARVLSSAQSTTAAEAKPGAPEAKPNAFPCGTIGKARLSRLMLGGNLISGCMHSRDLQYVNQLFRAYATEQKILETLRLAEECGINTVFETGENFVQKYNKQCHGHTRFPATST